MALAAPFALNIDHAPAPAFNDGVSRGLKDHGGKFDVPDIGHDICLVPRHAE